MFKWLRWLAVVPAAYAGFVGAVAFGFLELRVIDSFCPPDQWVSGFCEAAWYENAFSVAECIAVAVAAFLVVSLASVVAPANRKSVAILSYLVGAGFAVYFGASADKYLALAMALLAGALAVLMAFRVSDWLARRPRGVA
jgi:hypothetical protein